MHLLEKNNYIIGYINKCIVLLIFLLDSLYDMQIHMYNVYFQASIPTGNLFNVPTVTLGKH